MIYTLTLERSDGYRQVMKFDSRELESSNMDLVPYHAKDMYYRMKDIPEERHAVRGDFPPLRRWQRQQMQAISKLSREEQEEFYFGKWKDDSNDQSES